MFKKRWLYYLAILVLIMLILSDFTAIGQDSSDENYWIIPNNEPNDTISGIAMRSTSDILLTSRTGTIYASSNITNNYEAVYSAAEPLNDLAYWDQLVIAVGDNGFATTSNDSTTWTNIDLGVTVTENLNNLDIVDNHVWAVGDAGTILYSNDSGNTWDVQTSTRNVQLNDVEFIDNSTGWVVGEGGLIMKTTNGGDNWITINSDTSVDLNAIDLETSSSDRMYVVGDDGTFLISFGSSLGSSFNSVTTGTEADLFDVYSPTFNIAWAVGAEGTILGYRGNEIKGEQILEETSGEVTFYAVSAIGSEALAAGTNVFYNKVGLIPEFTTEKDWQDWWFFTQEVVPLLLGGLWAAVQVILFSLFIGFFIGLVMATMRTIQNRPLNFISTAYSDLFRNTPLLVQLFFISFGLPELGWNPPVFFDAVIALSLNTGAYQSEIIRSGIQAIPKGQMEAARSLGMDNVQSMRHIILPQAVRITIPPLSNEAVIMFLNTAQLSVIAYEEITRIGQLVATTTFLWSRTFLYVALTYFVITYSITQMLRKAEAALAIPGLGGGEI